MNATRILLVDDEENILRSLRRCLAPDGYAIEAFADPRSALARVQVAPFDLVLSDYRMPRMDGVEFLTHFKEIHPDSARLIISGQADMEGLLAAINEAEIYRFVSKPWENYDLRTTVRQALIHRNVLLENRRLADQVRRQKVQLEEQGRLIERLEREFPGISEVRRTADGAVVLDAD
jgi:two-component system probable response regulator PhcQ